MIIKRKKDCGLIQYYLLLRKSLVVRQDKDERNYHVFYHILEEANNVFHWICS